MMISWKKRVVIMVLHVTLVSTVTVQPPKSQVSVPGKIVNYTCEGKGYIEVTFNGQTMIDASNAANMYLNNLGIDFEQFGEPNSDTTSGYYITVNASFANNGTYFYCEDEADDSRTPTVYLYTVNGPPSPPEPPLVTAINLTTLNVSWTAPWTLPVNYYTLNMTNTTSSQTITELITTSMNELVTKTWPSDCDSLDFAVQANTDVGSSGFSEPSTTGFPNAQHDMKTNITVTTQTLANGVTVLKISLMELEGCYYELLTYSISVSYNHSNEKVMDYFGVLEFNNTSNQKGNIFEVSLLTFTLNVSSESYIQVNINISNSVANNILSTQTTLPVIVSSTSSKGSSSSTSSSSTSTSTSSSSSSSTSSASSSSTSSSTSSPTSMSSTPTTTNNPLDNLVLIAISSVLAVIVLCLALCLVGCGTLLVVHRRLHRVQQRRLAGQLMEVPLPKVMTTNPIYEQIDGLYEPIMPHNNIARLESVVSEPSHNGQMPSSNRQLCNDKSTSPTPGSKKFDDYIEMSALTSKCAIKPNPIVPRYTPTPGTTTKEVNIPNLPSKCEGPT